jgi:hypothetical protein
MSGALLNAKQAAELLNVPHVRLGRYVRFGDDEAGRPA